MCYVLPLLCMLGQLHVIQCIKGVMGLHVCGELEITGWGGDMENGGKCVGKEHEGTGIALAEMFICNIKLYTIIISGEKD